MVEQVILSTSRGCQESMAIRNEFCRLMQEGELKGPTKQPLKWHFVCKFCASVGACKNTFAAARRRRRPRNGIIMTVLVEIVCERERERDELRLLHLDQII